MMAHWIGRLCCAVLAGGLLACESSPTTDEGDSGFSADAAALEDGATPGDQGLPPGPGEWQLPEGYFEPARMPMTLVHPRDDDAPAWAYSKNAHPGIRWEIPVVVQGGAWPFRYEIVDDGGASGLAIGAELHRSEVDGFIVHEVTEAYGLLWWDAPIAGDYAIELRVTDQEGSEVVVPVSLRVGTEGWVFVDAEGGDDGNDGSRDAPFATLGALYGPDGAESPYTQHRVYLSGVVPMEGNRSNGNLRIAANPAPDPNLSPRIFVGMPGAGAVLEAYEGRIVLDAPGFYLANLEHRHREDYAPSGTYIHMVTAYQRTERFTLHDVTFSRFQGDPENVDLGNSSIVMFTRGAERPYVAVVGCTLTGPSGIFTSTYSLRHAVFEKNRVVDAALDLADGSVWALIYLKGDNEWVSVRANELWEGNTWNGPASALGLLEVRNVELAHNVIDTPFDSGRRGAMKLWTNSPQAGFEWTADTPVWIHRNTLRRRMHWGGGSLANMPDGTVRISRNVSEPGSIPEHSRIVSEDNLIGEALLDASLALTGDARSENLGRRGAQIAVPVD